MVQLRTLHSKLWRKRNPVFLTLVCLPMLLVSTLQGQTPAVKSSTPAGTASSVPLPLQQPAESSPSISLSPAVIMARGAFGQGLTQTLTLSNQTGMDFAFELVAEDVVVKDGKRIFAPAGETPGSIAATAVFSPKTIVVKAHTAASVDVRLTLPASTGIRAMVAMFKGTDKLPTASSSVGMTASLGTLITFNLSDEIKLEPDAVHVAPATAAANMTISQTIANTGREPVLPEGAAALLNEKGVLVGKAIFQPQRLLPGERLEFTAEYPDQLQPGAYRALCSFQFEGKTLTSSADFKVP
jgi:hypothetical protein